MKKFTTLLFAFLVLLMQANAQWTDSIIDMGLSMPTSFCLNDIDDDGDSDIVAAIWGVAHIKLYQNDNSSWSESLIDNNLGAVGIIVTDLDKDDKKDIVAAGYSSDLVKWYRNMGGSPTEWFGMVVDNSLLGAEFVEVADFDNDGYNDIVATGAKAGNLCWYKNDGTSENWTKTVIADNLNNAVVCKIVDFNKDGLQDVIVNARLDNKIVWYENENNAETWKEHIVDDDIKNPNNFDIGDMDNDGDIDIVSSATNESAVIVYENLGDGTSWQSYYVDTDIADAFSVIFADIDSDDNLDIVATNNNGGDVILYTNTPGLTTIDWVKSLITSGLVNSWDVKACDIDGDTDLDIILNQFIGNGKILCYLNPLVPNSINDNSVLQNAKLFPNPSNGKFSVIFNNADCLSAEIYDMQGRIIRNIQEIKRFDLQIDLSSFSKGIYLIKFTYKNSFETTKVILE